MYHVTKNTGLDEIKGEYSISHASCNHAIIQKVMFTIRGKLTARSAVVQIQPICYVTSAIFANDVTSVYADFANAVLPISTKTSIASLCFAMNELKMSDLMSRSLRQRH